MKIFIGGGSGFVGSALARHFAGKGFDVTVTGSSAKSAAFTNGPVRYISADTTRPGAWQESVAGSDVVINVAGRTIFNLWTDKYRQKIVDSRIKTTRNMVDAMTRPETVFVSCSAAGFYGDRGDEILTEESKPGDDFLAELSQKWEDTAFVARDAGIRTAVMRLGIVLGRDGGAVQKMKLPYSLCVGGPLGDGEHWFPWVHLEDVVAAFDFVILNNSISGVFNLVSPGSIKYKGFSKTFARNLSRPDIFKVPAFVVKGLLGGLGKTMLASQKVVPVRLARAGFKFRFEDVNEAIKQSL